MRRNPAKVWWPLWHVTVLLATMILNISAQIIVPTSLSRCPEGSGAPDTVHVLNFDAVSGGEQGEIIATGFPEALEVAQHVYNTKIRYGNVKVTGSTYPAHEQNISQCVDAAMIDCQHKNVVAVTGMVQTHFTEMLTEIIKPRNLLQVDISQAFQGSEQLVSKLMNYEYATALMSANLLWEFGITRCGLVYYDTDTRWFEEFERYSNQLGVTVEYFGVIQKLEFSGTGTKNAVQKIKEKDIRYIITHLHVTDLVMLLAHAFDEGLGSETKPLTWIAEGRSTDEDFLDDFDLYWTYRKVFPTAFSPYAIAQSTNATSIDILRLLEGSFGALQSLSLNELGERYYTEVLAKLNRTSTTQTNASKTTFSLVDRYLILFGDAQVSISYAVNSMSNAGYGCYLHRDNFTREAALTLYEFFKRVVADGFSGILEYNDFGDKITKNYTVYNCHSQHRLPEDPRQGQLKCVPHLILSSLTGELLWKSDVPVIWHDGSTTPPSPPPDDGRTVVALEKSQSQSTIWHTEVIIILIVSAAVVLCSFVLVFRMWRNYLHMQDLLKRDLTKRAAVVLNLDAPSTQALKMCERIANGGKVTKHEALTLANKLLDSKDLLLPDLRSQLSQHESPYNNNISAFLLQMVANAKNSRRVLKIPSDKGVRTPTRELSHSPQSSTTLLAASEFDSGGTPSVEEFEVQVITDQTAGSFSSCNKLGYDLTFDITAHKTANPLVTCTMHVINRLGLVEKLKLVEDKLIKFFTAVESGYLEDNPYHNATHAADVTLRLVSILWTSELYPTVISDLDMLAAILAAVIHDCGHLGKSNAFMVGIQHPIANQHNDQHVMENHALCQCLGIMSQLDFTKRLSQSDRRDLRKRIIAMVLATDMKEHFRVYSQFKQKIRRDGSVENVSTWLERLGADNLGLILETAIKVADLGHTTVKLDAHISWVEALQTEFFMQGDEERNLGMEVSPLCDRNKPRGGPASGENQVGFFEVICNPLFAAWVEAFPLCHILKDQALINFGYWEKDAIDAKITIEDVETKRCT